MVSVKFLGRECFIQPLLLSDFSIDSDLCFDDMLEQQGPGRWSEAMVLGNSTCILTLNASFELCLRKAFSYYWQDLEETSTNVLGTIVYQLQWGA